MIVNVDSKGGYYLKNFILGLGIGIVLVTIWFFVYASFSDETNSPEAVTEMLSDDEIVERAKELGMVSIKNLPSTQDAQTELTDNDVVEKARELGMLFPEEAASDASSISNEQEAEPDDQLDEVNLNTSTDEIPEETGEDDEPIEYVEFRVFAGMTARRVAKLLYEQNIITNSLDFENYIIEKSATTKIRTGRYKMAKNTDFSEILYILTTAPSERNN